MMMRLLDWVFSTPTTPPAWPRWLCGRLTNHDVAITGPTGHRRCRCAMWHGPRDPEKTVGPEPGLGFHQ